MESTYLKKKYNNRVLKARYSLVIESKIFLSLIGLIITNLRLFC